MVAGGVDAPDSWVDEGQRLRERCRQEGAHMKCPRCKTKRLVDIEVTLGDRRVTMHSCSYCDSRWWESEGESLGLPRVVELATGR